MPHAHGERSLICSARKYEIYILINVRALHVPSTRHWLPPLLLTLCFLVGFDRLFHFVFVFLFSCFGVVLFCRDFSSSLVIVLDFDIVFLVSIFFP